MSKITKPVPVVLPYSFPTKQYQPYRFYSMSRQGSLSIKIDVDRWKSSFVIEFDGHGRVSELAKKFIAEIDQYTRIPDEIRLRHLKKPSKRLMEVRTTTHSFCMHDVPTPYARTVADVIVPLAQALWSDLQAREAAYRALGIPLAA